jgi:hypothetical protein
VKFLSLLLLDFDSVASILHVRDGGQVIGYTRRMRAIKQSRFFNQQPNAALNNSIVIRRDSVGLFSSTLFAASKNRLQIAAGFEH